MFRGSADARIDTKGRLKIPSKFRSTLRDEFGTKLFVTSFGAPCMRIYPLTEWIEWEEILRKSGWGEDPKVVRFLRTVDFYGDEQEIDSQGRFLIHPRLRKHASMNGEVVVLGHPTNLLEVWNLEIFMELQAKEPLTEDVIRFVSGIVREARHGQGLPTPPGHDLGDDGTPPDD